MLLIHKPRNHKLLILVITSICSIGALLGLSALTYTPELSHAEQVTYPSLSNITYMQDMTADICKHSHENETKQLIDTRDGKTYWVTKLKDENCWMTQNLDLDITKEGLKASDTDILEDWNSATNPTYAPVATQTGSPSGFSYDSNNIQKSNVIVSYDPGINYCDSMIKDGCTLSVTQNNKHDAQGNYYSWGAATAGQAAILTSNTAGEQSTQSICPKAWTLPTGGALESQYGRLADGLTIQLINAPYYFVRSGYIDNSTYITDMTGRFWSATSANSGSAYALGINSDATITIKHNPNRSLGYSVRCVARTDPPETHTLSDLTYMQDMTMDVCKNSDIEETKQLIDRRDNKTYWVTKLKDNNCWMTQNLDLDIPAEGLKAEDTDIPVDWNSSSTYPPEVTQVTATPSGFSGNNVIASWDPAQGKADKYCGNNNNDACNLTMSSNSEHDAQGNYYSWVAATAGQAVNTTMVREATQSICPKNWRLPTGGGNTGEFYDIFNDITISTIIASPYYFAFSGQIASSSLQFAGYQGFYWSSTTDSIDSAYSMGITTNKIFPSSNFYRYAGNSIRCVSPGGEKQNYNNIEITINPQLTLDAASETIVNKTDANPSTGDLKIKVTSNQPYIVKLSSDNATMKSSTTSVTIPTKSGLLNTAENGWGIMKHDANEYTAITNTPNLFYQSASPEVKELLLKVGISTAPDLPSGEYSTDITVTATQN